MIGAKTRTALGVLSTVLIIAGFAAFALSIAFTAYAWFNPETLYGAHVPIFGFGLLGLGLLSGVGLRRLLRVDSHPDSSNITSNRHSKL